MTNTTRQAPVTSLADRPKIGRPARIDRAMIARAAYEIGLDRVTMKAVADHLGVSVPGLYHHVQGRDDLMRLGAEYSAAQIHVPIDHGQHWSAWLLEWANYSHDAFVAQPALLGQFLNSSLGVDRMVTHVDAGDRCAVAPGVQPRRGRRRLRDRQRLRARARRRRDPRHGIGARRPAGRSPSTSESSPPGRTTSCPHLRTLVAAARCDGDFTQRVLTVLAGIAVRRGEPWQRIVACNPSPTRRIHPSA